MNPVLYPLNVAATMAAAGAVGFTASGLVTNNLVEQTVMGATAAALSTLLLRSPDDFVEEEGVVLRLGKLKWTMEDFCRNWLITGRTGSGKTAAGLANMMSQLFRNVPNWGGMCIDQKGLFYRMLLKIARHYGREKDVVLLQVRPDGAAADWVPPFTYNWFEDDSLPGSSYAQLLIDVAQARGAVGTGGSSDHFASQAKIHIGQAIEAIRAMGGVPTFPSIYDFLTSPPAMQRALERLRSRHTEASVVAFNHFVEKFLTIAGEELSGVKSTITNTLFFYQHPDIVAVFGQARSTIDFSKTDQGKIYCCSIPQRFDTERAFLNTLLKMAWYSHIKKRFNLSEEDLAARNLNVLWADEGQRVVTKSELGMADHNQVDQVREAKGCVIFATQTERSFVPVLGKDIKNTLIDNLGNEIAFCQTNQEDAEILAKRIGERTLEKKSRSVGRQAGGFSETSSYQEKEEVFIKPHVLRNLKKHRKGAECVLRHCEKGFERTELPFTTFTNKLTAPTVAPIDENGQPFDPSVPAKLRAAGSWVDASEQIALPN